MLRSPERAPLLESADRGFRMAVVKNTLRSETGWSCHGKKKYFKVSGEKKLRGNQTEIVEWKIRNSLERIRMGWQSRVIEHQKVSKYLIQATEKRQGNELSLQTRDNSKGSNMCALERKIAQSREASQNQPKSPKPWLTKDKAHRSKKLVLENHFPSSDSHNQTHTIRASHIHNPTVKEDISRSRQEQLTRWEYHTAIHACYLSTQEAQTGRSEAQGHPQPHAEFEDMRLCFQKSKEGKVNSPGMQLNSLQRKPFLSHHIQALDGCWPWASGCCVLHQPSLLQNYIYSLFLCVYVYMGMRTHICVYHASL